MKRLLSICLFVFAVSVGAQDTQAPGGDHRLHRPAENRRMEHGMGRMHSMSRHRYVMHEGLPEAYRDLDNPLPATDTVLANGRRVYAATCSACHGETGAGDGPAGAALDPPPSNLRILPRNPRMSGDGYLYWTIAEGGVPISTAMPAFEATLTSEKIWSVIALLREGL